MEQKCRPLRWRLRQSSPYLKKLWTQYDRLVIKDGVLCWKIHHKSHQSPVFQAVLPLPLIPQVMQKLHGDPSSGHYAYDKTMDRAMRLCYWSHMARDVFSFCQTCLACQTCGSPVPSHQAPLTPMQPTCPFQIVAADLSVLPTSKSGHRYVLVVMDLFSRFINLFPLRDQTAQSVAKCIFEQYIRQHGAPESLLSDQGRQFESELVKTLCECLGVHKLRTTAYHPQCDGAVERFNRTMKNKLAKLLFKKGSDWDEHLHQVELAYNTTAHAVTGFMPFYLVHGREANLPLDILVGGCPTPPRLLSYNSPAQYANFVKKRLSAAFQTVARSNAKAKQSQKRYYDRHLRYCPYEEGDLVWINDPARSNKLAALWIGPYRVLRPCRAPEGHLPVTFEVVGQSNPQASPRVLHYNRLKRYTAPASSSQHGEEPSVPLKQAPATTAPVVPPITAFSWRVSCLLLSLQPFPQGTRSKPRQPLTQVVTSPPPPCLLGSPDSVPVVPVGHGLAPLPTCLPRVRRPPGRLADYLLT